jgi:hypothetical protein
MSNLSSRLVVVRVALVVAAFAARAGVAEAWPVRGPVARAERRVFRAQMALERELARPLGRVRVIEVPVYPVLPGGVPGAAAVGVLPPVASASAAESVVPAPAPAQAAVRPPVPPAAGAAQAGVARTAFEAPLPEPVAAPQPKAAPEPAADGTVSVLVRPESQPAGSPPARAAEPLLFPGAAQP